MKSLNSFINFRSSRPNLQSSNISLDRWLTVGSPSGLDAKWKQNPFMRFTVVLTLIFSIGVGNVWGDSYTITFGNNASSATAIASTVNASTAISDGTSYVTSKPFTVNSGNCYYGDTKTCIRIGQSGNSSSLSIALSSSGQVSATTIVVNANNPNNNNNKDAKLNVNDVGEQTTTGTADDYTFTINDDITSITLSGDKSIYIYSITVNYSTGCTNGTITYSAGSTTYTGSNAISGSHANDTKVCGSNLTLPGATFTTTGYTQDGWATSDGGAKVYNLSATNYSAEGNATLYPHWSANNYTVTWMSNGSQHTTTSVTYGSQPTLPSNPSSCDATSDTFYGWSTAEWSGTLDDVSDKTIYTDAFDMPAVTGDVTYYAVFAKAVKSDNFQLLGAAERFISGEDYLVEAYYSSTDHVLKAADYNSKAYQQVSENSWSLPSGGVNFDMSSRSSLCIWKIMSEGNNRFSFYNASDNKYLVLVDVLSGGNHYKNLIRSATKDATFIRTVVEGAGNNADKFTFESSSESGYYINSQTNYFHANATATQLYLYKRVTTYSKYLTTCCTKLGTINGSISRSQTKPSKIDSHLVIISVFQRSFCRMYLLNVLRLQWRLWAMLRLERPDCNALRIYSSFRYNGFNSFLVRLPFGRPICFPSALSLAKASRVRWLIRLRSISAERPKAKANTLDCISSPRR